MSDFQKIYKWYKAGYERRNKWYNANLKSVETHIKTLEAARTTPITTLQYVMNALYEYRNYNLSKPDLIPEDVFEESYNGLVTKYDFSIISLSEYYDTLSFKSRAKISESNARTRSHLEVDLGMFSVTINFPHELNNAPYNITSLNSLPAARPIGENKPKAIDGTRHPAYHPHIHQDGRLCLGTYGSQFNAATQEPSIYKDINDFNILSLFYNMAALLCRYNGSSLMFPNASIDKWIGFKCSVCGQFTTEADGVKCSKTHQIIHKDCAAEIGDKWYSLDIVKKCSICKCSTPLFVPVDNKILCGTCWEKNDE
jgi:hypothetical protein